MSLKKNTRGEIVAELEEVEHLVFSCISFSFIFSF